MSATERIRAMLDERGVEWTAPTSFDDTARYDTVAGGYWFHEFDGKMTIHGLTPEQAIAATLGATDARPTQVESSETCEVEESWHGESEMVEYRCTACHEYIAVEVVKPNGAQPPNYCPNCGRRIEQ